jgi:hypothetical protein
MSSSRMSSPFLSSRVSMILCASSSAFRYHLFMSLRAVIPWHRPPGQVWRSNLQISEGIASPIRARNDICYFLKCAENNFVYSGPVGFKSLLYKCTEFTLAVPSESIVDSSNALRILCWSSTGMFCRTRPIVR